MTESKCLARCLRHKSQATYFKKAIENRVEMQVNTEDSNYQ
jgi:hypothetical protein